MTCWADLGPERESIISQVVSALVVLLVTLPYYACVGYFAWFVDEGFAIYRNPDAKGETSVLEVLHHDFWGTSLNPPEGYNTHKSWRPLITLMYAGEWQLASRFGFQGFEMQSMRLVSCLVHSLNAVSALWFLRRLRVPVDRAVLAASLFAAHPVHVENIVYIVGRADSLSTSFCLAACSCYLRSSLGPSPRLRCRGYVALLLLTLAAGLCKETGFTVLFFLGCAEIVLRARLRHVVGLMASFALVGGWRIWYVGGTAAGFGYVDTPIRYQDAWLTRTLSYLFQHAYYAKLLVLPWHQSWDYSYDALPMVHSFADVRLLAIFTAYAAVAATAAHGLRVSARRPVALLGLGLVVIPFVPASNLIFLVGTTVGERLLYPSTLGWSLLVAAFTAGPRQKPRGTAWWVSVALLAVYVLNSNLRMGHWKNTKTLFETDALQWSRSSKVLHSKASELQAQGDLVGALESYLASLAVFDDQAITDYCIARIYIHLDNLEEASTRFDKILNGHGIGFHDGNDFLWMTDLGYVMTKMGQYEHGVHWLQEGLQRMPHSCFAWNALGVARANLGKIEESAQALAEGLQCDPGSASIWNNAAVVYAYGNALQQATEAMQRAVSLNASNPIVTHNAQVLSGQAGQDVRPIFDLYIPLPGRR